MALKSLGFAEVFRDDRTGKMAVDKTTLRRNDVGDDDFGGDDEAGEETGDDGDDISGRRDDRRNRRRGRQDNRRENRRDRQDDRRENRRDRQDDRSERRDDRRGNNKDDDMDRDWVTPAINAISNTPSGAGVALAWTIRPQHDFRAEDLTFTGGHANDTVESIFFGANPVWSNTTGTPTSIFGATSFLRGMLKGQEIKAGLDIVIRGTAGGSAASTATLVGDKPATRC